MKKRSSYRRLREELEIAQAVIEDLESIIEDMETERYRMMSLMESIFARVQIKQDEITKGGDLTTNKKTGVVNIEKPKLSTLRKYKP